MFNFLAQKKCRLLADRFDTPLQKSPFGIHFSYIAQIIMPSGSQFELICDFNGENCFNSFTVVLGLYPVSRSQIIQKFLISSKVDCSYGSICLELIEVPKELRKCGVATIAFESWLKVLHQISQLYNVRFNTIYGRVADGSNFTPRFSRKLYEHFDNFSCFSSG